jgi:transcriptional regulator with XRE-family HTH domain
MRGLAIGDIIRIIRVQLGMSQQVLAKRVGVPQSTISRLEKDFGNCTIKTLIKVFESLSCDLLVVPMLKLPVDTIRQIQAEKMAKKRLQYLAGTMNLEDQQPDTRLIDTLLQQEVNDLLNGRRTDLWNE